MQINTTQTLTHPLSLMLLPRFCPPSPPPSRPPSCQPHIMPAATPACSRATLTRSPPARRSCTRLLPCHKCTASSRRRVRAYFNVFALPSHTAACFAASSLPAAAGKDACAVMEEAPPSTFCSPCFNIFVSLFQYLQYTITTLSTKRLELYHKMDGLSIFQKMKRK